MIYGIHIIDGQPDPLSIEQRTEKQASQFYLIHTINSRLVILRFTSPLSLPQSQRVHFCAKQMALQCCTNVVWQSQAGEGQGDIV